MADNVTFDLFEDYAGIEQGNLFATTVTKAVEKISATQSTEQKSSTKKIEDFGEKIAGAKKDAYAIYQNMLRKAANSEIKVQPLSKSFPKPNYQKLLEEGVAGWRVSAVRAIREFLSPKPSVRAWNFDKWAENATELRDIAVGIMEGEIEEENFYSRLDELTKYWHFNANNEFEIEKKFEAYKEIGHDCDLSKLCFCEFTDGLIGLDSKKPTFKATLLADTLEELLQKYVE